jgi:hypothetical protein
MRKPELPSGNTPRGTRQKLRCLFPNGLDAERYFDRSKTKPSTHSYFSQFTVVLKILLASQLSEYIDQATKWTTRGSWFNSVRTGDFSLSRHTQTGFGTYSLSVGKICRGVTLVPLVPTVTKE